MARRDPRAVWTFRLATVVAVLCLLAGGTVSAAAQGRESDSFAWYQFFLGGTGGPSFWFRTGDTLDGPVHTNTHLQIDGDPWFGSDVTVGGGLTLVSGSEPVFEEGYILNFPVVPMPTAEDIRSTLRWAAMGGGLYGPPLFRNNTYYEVVLGVPSLGMLTCTAFDNDGTPIGPSNVFDVSALNGAAWFEETVRIHGVLDGVLTIGSERWIEITDDVLYEGSTPGSGPDPDCDDMLGLIAVGEAEGDIIVANTAPNQTDCEIHAVMMALDKYFEVEDWQTGPPRGDLTVHGGIIADRNVLTSQYDSYGNLLSGYYRDLHYDERMSGSAPPFFPERPSVSGSEEAVTVLSLAPCSPNPFSGSTTIRFSAPPGQRTAVDIYDVAGRRVARVFEGEIATRGNAVSWDGTNARGRRVASGVYVCMLRSSEVSAGTKVVVTR
jgi:hypothetical protein